ISVTVVMAARQAVFQHVALGERVAPNHPGQVVVAVHHRHFFQQLKCAAERSIPTCSWLRHCRPLLPRGARVCRRTWTMISCRNGLSAFPIASMRTPGQTQNPRKALVIDPDAAVLSIPERCHNLPKGRMANENGIMLLRSRPDRGARCASQGR